MNGGGVRGWMKYNGWCYERVRCQRKPPLILCSLKYGRMAIGGEM